MPNYKGKKVRIVSGTAKGRKLVGFSGNTIRPTSDRVREAIFSSLYSQLGTFSRLEVLDLYAGTGAMAIEALSRGAGSATLVDQSREAQKVIEKNLASTNLAGSASLMSGRVLEIIPRLGSRQEQFDLIFVDPPYSAPDIQDIIQAVNDFGILRSGGIMCVETANRVLLPGDFGKLACTDRRVYGTTAICYYKHKETDA